MIDFDIIAKHMCIVAVWADCEDKNPQVTKKALASARKYAEAFVKAYPKLSRQVLAVEGYGSHPDSGSPEAAFGHDLYLTARGHGVGFWDRKELEDNGLGDAISKPLRDDFRKWYIEAESSRGWLYLRTNIE